MTPDLLDPDLAALARVSLRAHRLRRGVAGRRRAQVTVAVDAAAEPPPDRPRTSTASRTPARRELTDLNVPLNRHGGNNTTPHQLAASTPTTAATTGTTRACRRRAATPGEVGDTFFASARAAGAQAMITIPTIDWVAKLGPNRCEARQLLDRQVRRADRQRLAVVPRRRQRHPHQRPVRHRQRSERRQRAVVGRVPAGLGAASRRPLGHERGRRRALLHPRQRAVDLARDASRRPSDRRDDGRGR